MDLDYMYYVDGIDTQTIRESKGKGLITTLNVIKQQKVEEDKEKQWLNDQLTINE